MTDPDLEVTRIRRFGTIVARKRSDGSISAWLARYSSPVDGRRVQRSFESVRDAESWLAGEHELVEMHRRGLKQWVHPTDRDRRKKAGSMTFDELADWYVDTHRKPDGTALRGAARRNLRTDVGHLKDVFGGMTLKQITPDVISKWYFGEHAEGEWVFPRMCQRLKAIMNLACSDKFGTGMPLLASNPFTLPIPPDPEPKSWEVPPLTGTQLAALYESMPEYDRLSVLLAAWAGGMRIGEACALRVSDFNLEARTMMVNHSVCRGEHDLGELRLGPTKSKHSKRVCPLPDLLVPLAASISPIEKTNPARIYSSPVGERDHSPRRPWAIISVKRANRRDARQRRSVRCVSLMRPCSCRTAARSVKRWTTSETPPKRS